tara:strand:- start:61 stop:501 length:441 start_codon:yes stop_codon:yes gene_type:complete
MISLQIESNGLDLSNIDQNWISYISKHILTDHNQIESNVSIIFSTDNHLKELKKEFFNQDVFTDTISFNLEELNDPIDGEIYISLDRISENAKIYNEKFDSEYKRVIIHSILHLIGFDDQTVKEKSKMTELENYYLSYDLEKKSLS